MTLARCKILIHPSTLSIIPQGPCKIIFFLFLFLVIITCIFISNHGSNSLLVPLSLSIYSSVDTDLLPYFHISFSIIISSSRPIPLENVKFSNYYSIGYFYQLASLLGAFYFPTQFPHSGHFTSRHNF